MSDDSPRVWQKLKVWSGPGILVYGLTITLACTDWIMSLDPVWYSTIFGMFFMVSRDVVGLGAAHRDSLPDA